MKYNLTYILEEIIKLPECIKKIILIYSGDNIDMKNTISDNEIYNKKSWIRWHKKRTWSWPIDNNNVDKISLASLTEKNIRKIYKKIY